jgi:hypothetical protein
MSSPNNVTKYTELSNSENTTNDTTADMSKTSLGSPGLRQSTTQPGELDPLYVIFEQHLYNFQDSDADRKTFVCAVVQEYIAYLRRLGVIVPQAFELPIAEELASTVNTMLVKKMYGFLSVQDYRKNVPGKVRRKARSKYSRLKARAPRKLG